MYLFLSLDQGQCVRRSGRSVQPCGVPEFSGREGEKIEGFIEDLKATANGDLLEMD